MIEYTSLLNFQTQQKYLAFMFLKLLGTDKGCTVATFSLDKVDFVFEFVF